MAHFAQIDDNNIVQQVLVIDRAEIDTGNWGDPDKWIQTSYNTHGGIYYTPGTNTPDPDQSKALHKNYAGVEYTWDGIGFAPPQPYPSWTKDTFTYLWSAPTPMPKKPWPPEIIHYRWNESTLSWDAVTTSLE